MVQAEQSVIGCLMMAPELLDKARAVLSPAMFEAQPLARIFSCMLELKKAGTPVDAVTVVSRLGDGYAAVIRECACIAPRIGTFPQYAAIVLDAWRERTLVTELQSLAISGRTADEMTAELERMAARQRSIMQKVHSASEQTFGEAVAQAYRDLLKPDTSLKTDWKHFNDVLGGLQRGCLYIIAARPGDGKTDFALHLAVQLAKRCRVDYRSLEMTKETTQGGERMIFEDIANVMNARPVKEIMRKTGLTKNRVYSLRMGCTFHMDYELLFALQRMGYEARVFAVGDPARRSRDGDGKIPAPVGPVTARAVSRSEMEPNGDKRRVVGRGATLERSESGVGQNIGAG